jgi:hypothetical protein
MADLYAETFYQFPKLFYDGILVHAGGFFKELTYQ